MDAGDSLHLSAVTITEAISVNGFHPADIRAAVLSQRDVALVSHDTWHTGYPEQLVIQVIVSELVYVAEKFQRFPGTGKGGRNEFEQRFRKIGRDVFIGKRRAQTTRMRPIRQRSILLYAKRFFLNAFEATPQAGLRVSRRKLVYPI
jgi:hypothetical protein